MVATPCSISGNSRITLVKHPSISHNRGKDRIVTMTYVMTEERTGL
jgi:hypothetical protein